MSLLAYVDDIVVSDPVVDLSIGGIPSGIPRVAAPSAYDYWHGSEIVASVGGLTQLCEVAIFDAAEAFQRDLRLCYPRSFFFQRFADILMAALSIFAGSLGHRPRVHGGVVTGSRIVALLARAFLVAYMWKRDGYRGWTVCQDHMRALFRTLLPLIEGFYM